MGAGSAGGGGGAGNCGPVTSNPASPRPEASAPVVSASAPPAPASEKASAAATVLVIFKDVRTVDSDNNMSPLSVVGFGATPHGTVTRSVIGRISPRWPSSHHGKAGADNGWRKPRSKTVSRTPVPEEKKPVSSRSDASRRNRIRPRARDWRSVFWVSSGVGGITSGSSHRWVTWLGAPC